MMENVHKGHNCVYKHVLCYVSEFKSIEQRNSMRIINVINIIFRICMG
jgi:hypothetical protein